MNPYLIEILTKMCTYVNADFDKIDFTSNNWFWSYEWTYEQEQDFRKWLYDYLKNDVKAQKTLYDHKTNSKVLKERVTWFIFDYGWKVNMSKFLMNKEDK